MTKLINFIILLLWIINISITSAGELRQTKSLRDKNRRLSSSSSAATKWAGDVKDQQIADDYQYLSGDYYTINDEHFLSRVRVQRQKQIGFEEGKKT